MKKKIVIIIFLFVGLFTVFIWIQKTSVCSFGYWLNPDLVCRVLDENDGKLLVEYFNSDTNEFHLYIQENRKDLLIEHPYGRVKKYSNKVDSNIIKFDLTDTKYLIVNGEKFPIVIKKQEY